MDLADGQEAAVVALLAGIAADRRWDPMLWRSRAACKGEEHLFFAPPGERPEAAEVREIAAVAHCAGCPVRRECRAYARRHREYGVWGGETEADRAWAGYGPDMPIGNVARIVAQVGRKR